jgi:toxin YhaV
VSDDTLEINGWTVYAYPLFLDQLDAIIGSVENARKKDPKGYKKKRAAKLLAAVLKVAFEDIPSDPTRDIYRQGGTLGEEYKHWFPGEIPAAVPSVFSLSANRGRQDHRARLGER